MGRSLNIGSADFLAAGGRNFGKRWAFRFRSASACPSYRCLTADGRGKDGCLTSCSWRGRRFGCRATRRRASRVRPGGGWNRGTRPGSRRPAAPWGRSSTCSGKTVSIRLHPPVHRFGTGSHSHFHFTADENQPPSCSRWFPYWFNLFKYLDSAYL